MGQSSQSGYWLRQLFTVLITTSAASMISARSLASTMVDTTALRTLNRSEWNVLQDHIDLSRRPPHSAARIVKVAHILGRDVLNVDRAVRTREHRPWDVREGLVEGEDHRIEGGASVEMVFEVVSRVLGLPFGALRLRSLPPQSFPFSLALALLLLFAFALLLLLSCPIAFLLRLALLLPRTLPLSVPPPPAASPPIPPSCRRVPSRTCSCLIRANCLSRSLNRPFPPLVAQRRPHQRRPRLRAMQVAKTQTAAPDYSCTAQRASASAGLCVRQALRAGDVHRTRRGPDALRGVRGAESVPVHQRYVASPAVGRDTGVLEERRGCRVVIRHRPGWCGVAARIKENRRRGHKRVSGGKLGGGWRGWSCGSESRSEWSTATASGRVDDHGLDMMRDVDGRLGGNCEIKRTWLDTPGDLRKGNKDDVHSAMRKTRTSISATTSPGTSIQSSIRPVAPTSLWTLLRAPSSSGILDIASTRGEDQVSATPSWRCFASVLEAEVDADAGGGYGGRRGRGDTREDHNHYAFAGGRARGGRRRSIQIPVEHGVCGSFTTAPAGVVWGKDGIAGGYRVAVVGRASVEIAVARSGSIPGQFEHIQERGNIYIQGDRLHIIMATVLHTPLSALPLPPSLLDHSRKRFRCFSDHPPAPQATSARSALTTPLLTRLPRTIITSPATRYVNKN
ncbi:hypothetical protein C8J57DRAFT_1480654 [Mycena rebaudengoi]|nr:hypothetical protein C8J57DRAFT_1480654 [Mycena rebaudengoi]